ncbi:hypothetical protein M0R45_036136 [Rubus argutus]|uniref:Uncharacterized protein n=1 Tax=Rubus argutus TaxID=59490 RepID=A0AAW1W0P2_RUBAR
MRTPVWLGSWQIGGRGAGDEDRAELGTGSTRGKTERNGRQGSTAKVGTLSSLDRWDRRRLGSGLVTVEDELLVSGLIAEDLQEKEVRPWELFMAEKGTTGLEEMRENLVDLRTETERRGL